jgi:hypothetical protein
MNSDVISESTNIDLLAEVCWIGFGLKNSYWFLPPSPPAEKATNSPEGMTSLRMVLVVRDVRSL